MTANTKIFGSSLNDLNSALKSTDFTKAVLLSIALVMPILIGIRTDQLQIGIFITMGVMLASPSDTGGNMRINTISILLSTLLAMVVIFITGNLSDSPWIFFPVLAVMVFGLSYISIYGFRASLISFTGLFALVLSFASIGEADLPVMQQVLLVGIGGLFFLLFVWLHQLLYPKEHIEELMSKTAILTADYLRIRGELVNPESNRRELNEKLLSLQIQLNETHESLRELLISRRRRSGKSNYQTRRLMIFGEMIDILELAMANPVNYQKTDELLRLRPDIVQDFQKLLFAMSDRLLEITENHQNPKRIGESVEIKRLLDKIGLQVNEYCSREANQFNENSVILRNFLKYQHLQSEKIDNIGRLVTNPDQKEINKFRKNDLRNFITESEFNFNMLVNNFNLGSTIFRHSLRITAVTLIGYLIGAFFELQNFYWILLTIIVIMRPNYGLTKTRSQERTVGTLIGGILAFGIVWLIHDKTLYAILSIVTLIVFFSLMQRNYKLAAVFITLNIVFVFALLNPNVYDVIQYRVIDTFIGAGLAVLANIFLWPAWEIKTVNHTLSKAISANSKFLREIAEFYNKKGEPTWSYKLARKEAFLAQSDLNASFQRMAQEPKSQQKYLGDLYRMTTLNHNFLAALASLNTYIIYHPTTPASDNFNKVIDYICENLSAAEAKLEGKEPKNLGGLSPEKILDITYGADIRDVISADDSETFTEEVHLVYEQLKWLLEVSEKMKNSDFKF